MDRKIILKFVEAINNQNLPLIIEMMADDFCFVDLWWLRK